MCRSRRELSNEYLLANLASIQPRTSPNKFVSSSSREFEFELRNFELLICNPVDFQVVGAEERGRPGFGAGAVRY